MGTSTLQAMQEAAEPYLIIQNLGPLPIGIILGSLLGLITLLLLDNKRLPAAVVVVCIGIGVGIFFGTHQGWSDVAMGINIPELLPYGLPTTGDFSLALLILALPQIPMTVGNAIIANADLSAQYFPRDGKRVSYKALCISMALGNLGSFFLGGMPLCHGAGGLASRYRFGARTAGSNVIIGGIFLFLGLVFGAQTIVIINTLPLSVLGVLLVFAGTQLALTILDITTRKDFFVILLILGITLASNLAAGFLVGIIVSRLLQWDKLTI
jgi:SulP family sulfate permease